MNVQENSNHAAKSQMLRPEPSYGFSPMRVLVRRRWQLLTCLLVVCTVAFTMTVLRQPKYQATCRVHVVMDQPRTTSLAFPNTANGQEYFNTQCQLIHTYPVLARAAQKLKNAGANWPSGDEGIKNLRKCVKIEPLPEARLIDIVGIEKTASAAATIANHVTAAFIETSAEARQADNERIIARVNEQIEQYNRKIEDQEDVLLRFRQEHLITAADSTLAAVENRIAQIEQRLTETQLTRMELQTRREKLLNLLTSGHGLGNDYIMLTEFQTDTTAVNLQQQINALQQSETQLAYVYLPGHQKLQAVRIQIAALQEKLLDHKARLIQTLFEDATQAYAAAVKDEENLMQLLHQQKEVGVKLTEQNQEYLKILAQLQITRQFKDDCVQKLRQFTLEEGIIESPVVVVDPAHVPKRPAGLSKAHELASILLLGLVFSIGFIFTLERFTNGSAEGINTVPPTYLPVFVAPPTQVLYQPPREQPDEILSLGKIDPMELGGTARHDKAFAARCQIVQINQSGPQAEVFRALRSRLLARFGTSPQSIVITGGAPQNGKTTCACNLALILAQTQRQVLLVDANPQAPDLPRVFGITKELPGWSDILTMDNPPAWEKALKTTPLDNLKVMYAGQTPQVLNGRDGNIATLHQQLKQSFDWIIYDAATVQTPFTKTLLQVVGKSICVSGTTKKSEQKEITEQIEHCGAVNLGVIENNTLGLKPSDAEISVTTKS